MEDKINLKELESELELFTQVVEVLATSKLTDLNALLKLDLTELVETAQIARDEGWYEEDTSMRQRTAETGT